MSKKDLLVISTFGRDAARDWYEIQRHFLDKYTPEYDYGVFLHGVKDEAFFKGSKIIGRMDGNLIYALPEMFHQIYLYFKKHEYKNYLLIDSDCFPVKENWYHNLIKVMNTKWYAAPVRTDNLDVCPHPCALFVKGEYIKERIFTFRRALEPVYNLVGEEVIDIGTGFKMRMEGKQICFPLVRSNFINIHPIVGAIYGDTFYHHGAGSRIPYFRSTGYWKKIRPEHSKAGKMCYHWLKTDPEKYIDKMRGVGVVDTQESLRSFFEEDR